MTIYTNSSWENVGEDDASEARGGALALKAAFTPRNGVTIAGYYWRQRAPTHVRKRARPATRCASAKPGLIRFSSYKRTTLAAAQNG